MIESLILGATQGIAEWLPVSSEGALALISVNLLGKENIGEIIRLALFLHLGTFFAALIYFRREVKEVLMTLFRYRVSTNEDKNILHFLVISTVVSGVLGYILLDIFIKFESQIELSGRVVTLIIGALLLFTAWLQLKKREGGGTSRQIGEVSLKDSIILGVAQGLAVLPGLSRSGLTVSTLLLRKVNDEAALKLSFLMSLPIVLAGNILLNSHMLLNFTISTISGLLSSFVLGLVTIHTLIKLARKVNFGYFVAIFGILMIVSVFI